MVEEQIIFFMTKAEGFPEKVMLLVYGKDVRVLFKNGICSRT
jgi:hypothetical protein